MNAGTARVFFDEIVQGDTANVSRISFFSDSSNLLDEYRLTTSTATTYRDLSVIVFLSEVDLNNLKTRATISQAASSFYITLEAGFVNNMVSFPSLPVSTTSQARVRNYAAHIPTAPTLVQLEHG